MTDHLTIRKRDEEFTRWRKRAANGLPKLCARVFALRTLSYMGCGFHWSIERDLGIVIAQVNDYDDGRFYNTFEACVSQMVLQVKTQALYRTVKKAEESAHCSSTA